MNIMIIVAVACGIASIICGVAATKINANVEGYKNFTIKLILLILCAVLLAFCIMTIKGIQGAVR